VAAGKGAKGASAPGASVQGAEFGEAKIWNSEIGPILANWCLHCNTDSAGSLAQQALAAER